ncbi:hypothetical protein L810_4300 [Burkholderia sp. AU4i]|nr:hypothetical protein L810_4300 [Burkholderia sp. AU4i]
MRLEDIREQFNSVGMGMCARPPLVRHAEHDSSRALVRTLLFHQHYDDRGDAPKAAT